MQAKGTKVPGEDAKRARVNGFPQTQSCPYQPTNNDNAVPRKVIKANVFIAEPSLATPSFVMGTDVGNAHLGHRIFVSI